MYCCNEHADTRNGKYGLFYFCKRCGKTKSANKSKFKKSHNYKDDWSDLSPTHWYDEGLDWEQHY